MKKVFLLAAIAVLGLTTSNAQNADNGIDKVIDQAKNGGFYAGANFGVSLISSNRVFNTGNDDNFGSFNFGLDLAYLFEVIPNLEVGAITGYTHFIASGEYSYVGDDFNVVMVNYKDASFVPVAASGRYYFADRKFFGGIDLGVAINVSGDAKTGFYARPKFGFNLNKITLIASFQSISGGQDYQSGNNVDVLSLNGFKSFNVGIEYGF